MPPDPRSTGTGGGLPLALGAYFIWGLIPLYFAMARAVPPVEMVAWRIMFTLPFCLAVVAVRRQQGAVMLAIRDRRVLLTLAASGLLIAANWLVYVFAVTHGHVLASSLGYYINPLVNVLAGTLFLGERLSSRQWAAVAVAGLGVAILAWGARDMLWISLTLAFSFGGYGLVRKLAPVESLPGLTVETLLLTIPATICLVWLATSPGGTSMGKSAELAAVLACSGVVTGTPLLLFAGAARRMDYSALGMVQYLAPTMVFVLGLTVFGEPLRPIQLGCFVLIWSAVAIFSWDLLARRKGAR
jgi:chloramphenicol-sensitive protein RarD